MRSSGPGLCLKPSVKSCRRATTQFPDKEAATRRKTFGGGGQFWVPIGQITEISRSETGSNDAISMTYGKLAGEPGFEPGLTESESAGLPLTYSPTPGANGVPGSCAVGRRSLMRGIYRYLILLFKAPRCFFCENDDRGQIPALFPPCQFSGERVLSVGGANCYNFSNEAYASGAWPV